MLVGVRYYISHSIRRRNRFGGDSLGFVGGFSPDSLSERAEGRAAGVEGGACMYAPERGDEFFSIHGC